jgi:hypothetical protein
MYICIVYTSSNCDESFLQYLKILQANTFIAKTNKQQ